MGLANQTYYTFKAQVPTAPDVAGSTIGYTPGRGYYATAKKPSGLVAAAAAPTSGGAPPGLLGAYPAAPTPAQQVKLAQSWLDPQVSAATSSINNRVNAADHAITGYTQDAVKQLQGIDWNAPYQGAEQQQAAVDAALQQSLAGNGSDLAKSLGTRLGAIADPSVAAASAAVAANGTGNANTQVAQGSSALSSLIAGAAAAGEYGKKQPAVQRLAGLQQLATTNQSASNDLATQVASIKSQLPSILQSLRSEADTLSSNRAAAGVDLYKFGTSRTDALAAGATKAAITATAPSPSFSRANGYVSDASGDPILDANGNLRPIAGYKLAADGQGVVKVAAGSSGAAAAKAKASAIKSATSTARSVITSNQSKQTTYKAEPKTDQFGNIVKDGAGNPVMTRVPVGSHASGSYYAAIHQIVANVTPDLAGYMTPDQIIQFAQRLANTYWQPGEGGRPGAGK